jgi:tRNA(fMet)-specific endonuclease VapC
MKIFDTDILTDLLNEVPADVARATLIPRSVQAITVVSAEEVLRGQLNSLRQAAAGKSKITLPDAYAYFLDDLTGLASYFMLPYTPAADAEFTRLRAQKVRIGTQDLRIASVALANAATVVTRNARDFALVPGLLLEIWN